MRLNLMSDVQYLSPKRAVKVRDQSFLLGVSIKHRYCGGGESTPTNNTPTVRLANVRSKSRHNSRITIFIKITPEFVVADVVVVYVIIHYCVCVCVCEINVMKILFEIRTNEQKQEGGAFEKLEFFCFRLRREKFRFFPSGKKFRNFARNSRIFFR